MNGEQSMTDDLLYEVRDGVGYVTFNRPQARNAMTFAMYERLAEICEAVNDDRSMRALLMTGAGEKAFAAGTDISQFRAFSSAEDAIDYESRIDRVLGAIERCRVPTVAAVSGACTGGGAAIAACCDLRVATKTARFGFPVARTLGNCLSMNNYARLAALIGPARVKDLVFTARLVEAPEAQAIGLVTEVVEDYETLKARSEALVREIVDRAPLTLQATKEALRRLMPRLAENEGRDLVLMCYLSEDFREGMEAFLNKRKPVWKGK
jgi:enoyl-CoA hydratase/carnithine racemase